MCGNDTDKNNDYIEDAMCQQEPIMKVLLVIMLTPLRHNHVQVLRLMCLQSIVNSGLKPKVLENYWFDMSDKMNRIMTCPW